MCSTLQLVLVLVQSRTRDASNTCIFYHQIYTYIFERTLCSIVSKRYKSLMSILTPPIITRICRLRPNCTEKKPRSLRIVAPTAVIDEYTFPLLLIAYKVESTRARIIIHASPEGAIDLVFGSWTSQHNKCQYQ